MALHRALRRMAGLIFGGGVLGAGGRLPKARRGRFFIAQLIIMKLIYGRGFGTARSMIIGRVFLVLAGACQFGHGVGGFATNFVHSLPGLRRDLINYYFSNERCVRFRPTGHWQGPSSATLNRHSPQQGSTGAYRGVSRRGAPPPPLLRPKQRRRRRARSLGAGARRDHRPRFWPGYVWRRRAAVARKAPQSPS